MYYWSEIFYFVSVRLIINKTLLSLIINFQIKSFSIIVKKTW